MDRKKENRSPRTTKQINIGAVISGVGFLLYMAVRALGLEILSGVVCIGFAIAAVWTFFAAIDLRSENKEAVSYNLLWGTGALAIMLGACAVLTVKLWLGL